jgi:DNA-directed RNA polymerase subunit E'/Rpb7
MQSRHHKHQERKIYGVYIKSLLNIKVVLSIKEVGKNIKQNLEKKIVAQIEGKCTESGYIQPNSVKIMSYSSGNVISDLIEFHAIYECMISHPVEGMLIEAICKTVTKAGIHAQVIDEDGNMPITVFVAKDHHHIDQLFNSVGENDKITVNVIGTRYELNDPYICVISKLVSTEKAIYGKDQRPKARIHILDN